MENLLKNKDYLQISGDELEEEKEKSRKKTNRKRSDSSRSSYSSSKSQRKRRKNKIRKRKHSFSRSRSSSYSSRNNKNYKRKKPERKRRYSDDSSESSYSEEKKNGKDNQDGDKKYKKKDYDEKKNEFYDSSDSEKKRRKSKWTEVNNDEENNKNLNKKDKDEKNRKDNQPPIVKEKPNFEPTGILAKETNTVNGILLKFTEPLDSAEPTEEWRLYSFKDSNVQSILHIDKQSYYLIGKDDRICNIIVNHPSCSRQHAVLQYRKIDGIVKPYLLDLESTNGSFVDKEKIESARYYELKNYDMINFGMSTRDYILIKGDSFDYNKIRK